MYVYLAQTQVYIFALFEVCSFVNFIALFYFGLTPENEAHHFA
jgi:hypothetical protein